MKDDPIEKILWPTMYAMALFVGLFAMEHFKLFSTPPTRSIYLWLMERTF